MRVLVYVSLEVEAFNKAVVDGSAGQKIGKILETTKPEAVYFLDRNGERTGILVVDLSDASKIPSIVEPWMLLTLPADSSFHSANVDNIVLGPAAVAATPEPDSLVLLGTGALGLLSTVRRRARA